ncbi:MAG TPA: hypothetical protein VFM10_00240, partial [Terriglobales bacterium]|nr:hypothetical protein [Terriglobales bacterium]
MREAGRGNWQGAADHFIDALQFAPESTAIREHLNRANRELADTASAADIAALRARINDAIAASGIEALRQRRLDEVNAQRLAGMIADFRSHAVLARRPSNSNGYGTYLRVALLPHP